MNKEELEKEARKDVDSLNGIDLVSSTMIAIDKYGAYKLGRYDGYLASAEPREKRISELEAENEQIKNSDTLCKLIGEQKRKITDLEAQIEKMKKYIKACWVEENLNDYSSYITNTRDEFKDLVHELNEEIRNGR